MAHPWQIAFTGLMQALAILAFYYLFSIALGFSVRQVMHLTRVEWNQLRVRRFWLINTFFAPVSFGLFALISWFLHLRADEIGFNFNHWQTSVGIAVPLALLLGAPGALSAPRVARSGISPMKFPFGRTLFDTVGAIAYAALLVGPLEEILFRGILQTVLMRAMPQALHVGASSIYLGTIIAAILFVLYHYRNVLIGGETRTQFLLLMPGRTLVSFIVALIFQGTGSLLGPILFHNIADTLTIGAFSIIIYQMRQRGEWPPKQAADPSISGA